MTTLTLTDKRGDAAAIDDCRDDPDFSDAGKGRFG